MADPDDLFIVKNHYWIGNYQMAIEEGNILSKFQHLKNELDYYIFRSHICLHQYQVIDQIDDNTNTSLVLRLVKLYCTYIRMKQEIDKGVENDDLKTQKQLVFLTLNEWLKDINAVANPFLILIASEIHLMESNYPTALSIIRLPSRLNLEQYALSVQILLKMSHVTEAEKLIKEMQKIEEDSTLTQLAQSWVWNYQGNIMKCQESLLLYKELSERFGTSVTLLQNMGISYIHMKKYRDAEKVLLEAFNQDKTNVVTIINLIAVGSYIYSDENQLQQLVSALQEVSPCNPWLEKYGQLCKGFDRIAMQHQL